MALQHSKLEEVTIDFELIEQLKIEEAIDDVYCCLGTTIKAAGSKEAFTKVDYTYVVQLAEWCKNNGGQQFSVVSSVGASINTSNFYLQTKGQMEDAISALQLPATHIFRPSLLLGKRKEFRFGEKASELIMPLFNPLLKGKLRKYKPIQANEVATSMFKKAQMGVGGNFVYEGAEIK